MRVGWREAEGEWERGRRRWEEVRRGEIKREMVVKGVFEVLSERKVSNEVETGNIAVEELPESE